MKRLRIKQIDRVALVDRGDNPEAHVEIWKRAKVEKDSRSDGRTATTLEGLTGELQNLVGRFMLDRHDRAGPVSRDVATARVLAANPSLHRRLEQAARADALHKRVDDAPVWREYDEALSTLTKALGGDDVILGRQLVRKSFPKLYRRATETGPESY